MNDLLVYIVAGVLAVIFGLSALAARLPQVAWLQAFRIQPPQLSDEQKARMRRRANVTAGVELILMGIGIPLAYLVVTVMLFNEFTPLASTIVLAGSVLCIALGFTAIIRSRR